MERRKFTREFKLEAVRLIKDRGVSYVQASQDLGVQTSQLRDWMKLREVKKRIRPLFAQERAALNAGLFVDGLLGDERQSTMTGEIQTPLGPASSLSARRWIWPNVE
jgi:transposase-like protein